MITWYVIHGREVFFPWNKPTKYRPGPLAEIARSYYIAVAKKEKRFRFACRSASYVNFEFQVKNAVHLYIRFNNIYLHIRLLKLYVSLYYPKLNDFFIVSDKLYTFYLNLRWSKIFLYVPVYVGL